MKDTFEKNHLGWQILQKLRHLSCMWSSFVLLPAPHMITWALPGIVESSPWVLSSVIKAPSPQKKHLKPRRYLNRLIHYFSCPNPRIVPQYFIVKECVPHFYMVSECSQKTNPQNCSWTVLGVALKLIWKSKIFWRKIL